MAQFDDETIVVYQAYCPSIATFLTENGYFGGPDFSFSRTSWIKPSFLWMMFRSDWGTSLDQEVVLALRMRRSHFDALLERAVPTRFKADDFPDEEAWRLKVKRSDVQVQWDPDRDPAGAKVERRAIQLALRGEALAAFRGPAFVDVSDVSDLVATLRDSLDTKDWPDLETPIEHPYPVRDDAIRVLS